MFSINEHPSKLFNEDIFHSQINTSSTSAPHNHTFSNGTFNNTKNSTDLTPQHNQSSYDPNNGTGDVGKEYRSRNGSTGLASGLGILNQYPRKGSIFDHSQFQLDNNKNIMTFPFTNSANMSPNSEGSIDASTGVGGSVSSDPFELNTSLWNNTQLQQQGQGQQQQTQPSLHHFNSISASTNASVPFSSGLNLGSAERRASYNDYYPSQQQIPLTAPPTTSSRFNTNYTIWSNKGVNNNMIDDYTNDLMMQQQAQQAQFQAQQAQFQQFAPRYPIENGFLISPRRHSYTPNSSIGSPPTNYQQFDLNYGSFVPEVDQMNPIPGMNPNSVTESSSAFQQAYQSVDFYFTEDQYKRVKFKDYGGSESSSMMENLITKGAQLPRFTGNSLPSTQLVLIAFKAGRVDCFCLPENSPLKLKLNDLVVVEADRGRDLGKIVKLDCSIDEARLLKYLQHQEQQAALASFENQGSISSQQSIGSPLPQNAQSSPSQNGGSTNNNVPTLHFPKPIVRFAMPNEVYQLVNKSNDEEKAKKICCLKIASSNLSSMAVIDSEYQWDRKKLTFYYNANHRIDFRDLVRELFRIYKTRIWMCAVSADVKDPAQEHTADCTDGDNSVGLWSEQGKDPTMFIPRQFGSPEQGSIWK